MLVYLWKIINAVVVVSLLLTAAAASSETLKYYNFTNLTGDGLLLVNKNEVLLVANKALGTSTSAIFSLESDDDWRSITTIARRDLGDNYPTSTVIKNGDIHVIQSELDRFMGETAYDRLHMKIKASLVNVGAVTK